MKVQVHRWSEASPDVKRRLLRRSQTNITDLLTTVQPIVDRVRAEGDAALVHLTGRFDGAQIGELGIAVRPEEFEEAERSLDASLRRALDYAIENVRTFHQSQVHRADQSVQVRPGIVATERVTPIDSVGLYVPSGRGSFPSMMYMLGVPAVLAGVETIAVTTPPREDGKVDPAVLYAAASCGIRTVYRIGGAQAIAALAWGTETVPAVRKVVGPGSAYVAAAKRLVADQIDVGLPAGPSESIVVADADADPWVVALDLMIEAEHGSDSAALLVTSSPEVADHVQTHMTHLLQDVPEPRKTFLTDVFSTYGGIILTGDDHESAAVVNEFAPEHLLLHTRDPHATAAEIRNASEILLGPHTAFSLANYATGPNAVLPTGGWAHTFGPVSVGDFQKSATVVEVTETGYAEMRDHVIRLADHEGFYTHAAALRERHRPE
ncbi:MAG: histidinol dehydrogenase [Alkalispirochaeta sp.]